MTDLVMREIIENVKQTIAQKKYILWAYPIALKLQKYHYSLATQWAIECIQIYSFEVKPGKLSKLNKYVQQIIEKQNILTLTPLQCEEISREIWWLSDRDDFQTAISRLWWSVSAFKNEYESCEYDGIIETARTVEVLLFDNRHLLDKFIEAALRIDEEYELQKNVCN